VKRAVKVLIRAPTLSIPEAMKLADFSAEECADPALRRHIQRALPGGSRKRFRTLVVDKHPPLVDGRKKITKFASQRVSKKTTPATAPIPDVADAGTIIMDGAPPPTKQKAPEVMVEQGCGGSVIEINEHDVLIGYQKQKNPGNINFCNVMEEYKEEFFNSRDCEKRYVCARLVAQIRNAHPPGRFLKVDPFNPGSYLEVGDLIAWQKASQTFHYYKPADVDKLREKARKRAAPRRCKFCVQHGKSNTVAVKCPGSTPRGTCTGGLLGKSLQCTVCGFHQMSLPNARTKMSVQSRCYSAIITRKDTQCKEHG
jgi:hypothetical protein